MGKVSLSVYSPGPVPGVHFGKEFRVRTRETGLSAYRRRGSPVFFDFPGLRLRPLRLAESMRA